MKNEKKKNLTSYRLEGSTSRVLQKRRRLILKTKDESIKILISDLAIVEFNVLRSISHSNWKVN
jgi:hypothetical protein